MMYALATKLLHCLPPETAHTVAVKMLRLLPTIDVTRDIDLTGLSQDLLGRHFPHPLGLAAGFDKHATVFDKLGKLGFSLVETGTITPRPQSGNAKPRLFRLTEQAAIINRYGFNSKGAAYAKHHLNHYPHTVVTGVNLGKNKTTTDAVADFLQGAAALLHCADYFTINVSSPNTPGLRDLQTATALEPIITGINTLIQQEQRDVPLFIKLAPDLSLAQETTLLEFLTTMPIAGIVVSNTTISRDGVQLSPYCHEVGGLSGPPLTTRATQMLARAFRITQGRIILIGCGGISSGQDAYEKLCAGANLLQVYTAFIYHGPLIIKKILLELQAILAAKGIKSINEIIGSKPEPD